MTEPRARIVTLGALYASRPGAGGPADLTARRKPLCLLVYLLLSRPGGAFHQRSSLGALFWPESDESHARASLRQALRTIDRSLGPILERRGQEELRVSPAAVWIDVRHFRAAVEQEDWARAVSLYRGPFLDGVHVPGAAEFERWTDRVQLESTSAYKTALRHLAEGSAEPVGELTRTRLWQELSTLAPYDGATALSLARALEGVGNPEEARTALQGYLDRLGSDAALEAPDGVLEELERLPKPPYPAQPGLTRSPETHPSKERSLRKERVLAAPREAPETPPRPSPPPPPQATRVTATMREKGRSRSFLWAGLAGAGMVAFIALGPSPGPKAPAETTPLRVAVPPLMGAGEAIHRQALSLIVGEELSRLGEVQVIPYHVLSRELLRTGADVGDPTLDRLNAARELRANLVVLGTIFPSEVDGPRVVLDLVDPLSGESLGPSILSNTDAQDPARDAAARAATRIADAFNRPPAVRGDHAQTQNPPVLEAYLELVQALDAFAAQDIPSAEAHARRALELDSTFAPARIQLATQLGNRGDFEGAAALVDAVHRDVRSLTAWDREDLEWIDAVLAADRPRRLEIVERGGLRFTDHQLAYELEGMARIRASIAVLKRAETNNRWPEYTQREAVQWGIGLHLLGDHGEELRLIRRRGGELGESWAALLEIRALAANGQVREAEEALRRAQVDADPLYRAAVAYELGLELMAHGEEPWGGGWSSKAADAIPEGATPGSRLHQLRSDALYAAGRWPEARAAMEARLAHDADDVDARGALAVIDARTGAERPEAIRAVGEEIARGGPRATQGARTIWRARIAAALGEDEEVPQFLDLALERGAARPRWVHVHPEWRFLKDRSVLDRWLDVS